MDKNTLWGLLLMGAVIFGFMYLSRPNEQQQRELAEQQAKAEAERTPASPDLKLDSLTPAEVSGIAATIRELGVRDTANGTTTLAIGKVDLKLAADGTVGGTIFTDGDKAGVDAAAIVYNRAQDIPLQAARHRHVKPQVIPGRCCPLQRLCPLSPGRLNHHCARE